MKRNSSVQWILVPLLALLTASARAEGQGARTPLFPIGAQLGLIAKPEDGPMTRYGPLGPYSHLRLAADRADGPTEVGMAGGYIWTLLMNGESDKVDKLFAEWNDPRQRFIDGRPRIALFKIWVDGTFTGPQTRNQQYDLIERWRARNPKSPGAKLMEIQY